MKLRNIYLKNTKSALVAHTHETAQRELEDHVTLERNKVAHILQQEKARSVIVAVAQVGDDERIAESRVLALVKPVHAAETLTRWSTTEQLYLTLGWQKLPTRSFSSSINDKFQDSVAVVGKYRRFRIVKTERLSCRWFALNGPHRLGYTGLMKAL